MTQSDTQAALAAIDRDDMLELAKQMIRIPSFKTEETELARFMADYLGRRGYEVQLQEVEPGRFQTIATLRGEGGGKSLMFNGHLDIDPLAFGWKRDPWEPSVEGDRLFGAGVRNMQAGVASMVQAAEAVRRSGVRLKGDLVLACVVGELQGGVGSSYLCEHGPLTDMAVITEPHGPGQRNDSPRGCRQHSGAHNRQVETHQPAARLGGRHRQDAQGYPRHTGCRIHLRASGGPARAAPG